MEGVGRAVRIVGVILVGGTEGAGSRGSWEQRELGAEGAGSRGSWEQEERSANEE